MSRLLLLAALLACGAIALTPSSVNANCSRCISGVPACEAANYSHCEIWTEGKFTICETSYEMCAWVYDGERVSADGSLAAAYMGDATASGAAQVRGCHGLITDRNYGKERVAAVRRASRRLVI